MLYSNLPSRFFSIILISLLVPAWGAGEIKTWTGYGGGSQWINPLNWSGQSLPLATDDVMLDNGDLPVSFQVILPDQPVVLRTIQIKPSPGRNIELILPATNILTDAFSVTGPGYGIALYAGAIFHNASGLTSGESLMIADSMIIYDGARYIHQTRASHANSILKLLSTAPGTEQGIFDFDVPRAAYTISVSNRTYGSLELHATAYGATVSYTCTGANPLLIQGNLRLGSNVHLSMNLSGPNGNIQLRGDFIQEGGQMNLSGGGTNNTVLRVKGDLYQSPEAVITESTNGNPFLELNGEHIQEIAMAGRILNQVGFRMNNVAGAKLRLPLTLPWDLDLDQGNMYSSSTEILILDSACRIHVDSSGLSGSHIEGPLRKQGLNGEYDFLFPVGKDGNLRWIELKQATGNYTVEFMHENPATIGNNLGNGIDHISKLEYWTLKADGIISDQAKIELSFASGQSGGVTDPNYLQVARFQSSQWADAGHSATTGNFLQGSVLSDPTDFSSSYYTLASTVNLENPLPQTVLELKVKETSGSVLFSWKLQNTEEADHFDLLEETGGQLKAIARVEAVHLQNQYLWSGLYAMKKGKHYFRIRMTDIHGLTYSGNIVFFDKTDDDMCLRWLPGNRHGSTGQILIQTSAFPKYWKYDILTIGGQCLLKGGVDLIEEKTYIRMNPGLISTGLYIFRAFDPGGKLHSLKFKND